MNGEQQAATAALAGVRIVDLTTVVMGPSATQMLGDMGADVIKVESLDGDVTRHTGAKRTAGMAGWFLNINRGKRSLAVDLKTEDGREAVVRLAAEADVLLYNIRPAAMGRLGLDYDDLAAVNPRLVYVGALGFGRGGRYANLPAYDDLIQAATGLPWLFRYAGADSARFCPTPIVDRLLASHVAMNILAGLHAQTLTGRGQRIDVPMFETMASVVLGDHFGGELFEPPVAPWGYRRMLAPERKPYPTSDGYVAALPYSDKQWRAFFAAVGQSHRYEGDPRFATDDLRLRHVNDLYVMVAQITPERTTADWLALFRRLDIAAMPVNSVEDLIGSDHLRDVGFFETVEHPSEGPIHQMRSPYSWSDTQPAPGRPAPNLGEHSREILIEAGYDAAAADRLIDRGIVRQWQAAPQ